ncbi:MULTISPECIES: hypothetical protein [Clostridium]|uniref:Uncharacterized protein n=1 Tax=Clostridium ragsdalei P11 TaxID=1353534 RepID=A0A1A6AQR7_9CLOT|nr:MULTISPECIES: hypothetical protein [Clostridium]OBR92421.1 hypothetical protein CLRAG_24660 [Clostridium ragsdalei P11]QXE18453.1 hypothetical protein B5S50_06150 [Clostridium sp. 001]
MLLSYKFTNNIPLFKCDICGNCSNFVESISYTNIKNRGCCWYFPKYNLVDIKNIINNGNINFIYYLSSIPNCVESYDIRVKGTFFKNQYDNYTENNIKYSDFDSSLFFRLCPFLKKDGCKLSFSLRPHPCNLYLCREAIQLAGKEYTMYSRERKDYYAYCNYFNECLKEDLKSNNTTLSDNLEESLDILNSSTLPPFQPRKLQNIYIDYSTCHHSA